MGIASSSEIRELEKNVETLTQRLELVENSTMRIGESVQNISDRQCTIDERLSILSEKILNIQLLHEGRSVYSKHQQHTRSFMKIV